MDAIEHALFILFLYIMEHFGNYSTVAHSYIVAGQSNEVGWLAEISEIL